MKTLKGNWLRFSSKWVVREENCAPKKFWINCFSPVRYNYLFLNHGRWRFVNEPPDELHFVYTPTWKLGTENWVKSMSMNFQFFWISKIPIPNSNFEERRSKNDYYYKMKIEIDGSNAISKKYEAKILMASKVPWACNWLLIVSGKVRAACALPTFRHYTVTGSWEEQ